MTCCTTMLFFCTILAVPVSATTYLVTPDGTGDYPTIQLAVDAVVDGDIIELTPGTFTGDGNRDVDYLGRAITIRSQSGDPAGCVIDCEGTASDPVNRDADRIVSFLPVDRSLSARKRLTGDPFCCHL